MHECDSNARCSNTIGSYNCDCNTGFEGDGVGCSGTRRFLYTNCQNVQIFTNAIDMLTIATLTLVVQILKEVLHVHVMLDTTETEKIVLMLTNVTLAYTTVIQMTPFFI